MTARSPLRSGRVRVGRRDRGTAALETVALVPIIIVAGILVLQLGVAVWTTVAADTAARSAARAVTLHRGAFDAARNSLPGTLSVRPEDVDVSMLQDPSGVKVTLTIKIPRVMSVLPVFTVRRDAVMPDIGP